MPFGPAAGVRNVPLPSGTPSSTPPVAVAGSALSRVTTPPRSAVGARSPLAKGLGPGGPACPCALPKSRQPLAAGSRLDRSVPGSAGSVPWIRASTGARDQAGKPRSQSVRVLRCGCRRRSHCGGIGSRPVAGEPPVLPIRPFSMGPTAAPRRSRGASAAGPRGRAGALVGCRAVGGLHLPIIPLRRTLQECR